MSYSLSAVCCSMFPDLCPQIHRDRCNPLLSRKLQGDNSEVCNPPDRVSFNYHAIYSLSFIKGDFSFNLVLSLSSSSDSRVNLEFSKWSNDGELSKL